MIEKLNIITLGNNKKYVVVEILQEYNHEYLFLNRVNNNEELLEEKIVVEKVKTDTGYGIKTIEDEEIIKRICQKFLQSI